MVDGALESVAGKIDVVIAGAAEDEVEMKKSLLVWILAIRIYYSQTNNRKICLVGKGLSCNRAMRGNESSIRGSQMHATLRLK